MKATMKNRYGEISGMFEVSVYAIDFFRLSKISLPEKRKIFVNTITRSAPHTFFYASDNRSKVVVHQDHVCSLLGHIRASDAHGHT